ncbi:hypothetical protein Deipr_0280 [Deinococcus proteolyticus MRP]|uniref:Uncharacterized protein n=1 Tax=Deinococcus proteolyticus (strain ATCC 35074 / DSM 20540 / JCM 6276 / NBRC 101906 / NCIMB 13154 / VKM Ac-1939 / CCM 2703 / MRP) TaxID=693977 RepID=F0RJ45_DEIPM|nr:hypothetical protein Deipr_0280 [Deinococcus proteolyticus MRP]
MSKYFYLDGVQILPIKQKSSLKAERISNIYGLQKLKELSRQ